MMQLFLVQGNELVFARAKAYLRGMLEDMNSMTCVDALDECSGVIALFGRIIEHEVHTSLIQCYGIQRSED